MNSSPPPSPAPLPPAEEAPYGTWRSPITSEAIVSEVIGLSTPRQSPGRVCWLESRPAEAGRNTLMCRPSATPIENMETTPADFNIRSRVHEYGGGAYSIYQKGIVFVNDADQDLYLQRPDQAPIPLTRDQGLRYADPELAPEPAASTSPHRPYLVCVREDHRVQDTEPVNTLVRIHLETGGPGEPVAEGKDFYATPRISPDGTRLAWLSWNHPQMPWDGTELWLVDLDAEGNPTNPRRIAGGKAESVFQPQWSPAGELYYVSDRSGWWNLYRYQGSGDRAEALHPMEAEFGLPQWVFGMSTYAFTQGGDLVCTYSRDGIWQLAVIAADNRQWREVATPYTDISDLAGGGDSIVFRAAAPDRAPAIVAFDPVGDRLEVIATSMDLALPAGILSSPGAISYPSGDNGDATAHALYYPPTNPAYRAPAGERPPLLVKSHGGPTAATSTALNLGIQFWTSRGFAVLDVNYRGSTGYGRAYREQLTGQWGIADVEDCIHGARRLIQQGLADPARCAIRGSSAGGYTTLAALTFHHLFQAGASYYGIGDLEALTADTHKFEAHYLDSLIGPYPQRRDLYRRRSPIHAARRLSCPVIFFQGEEDKVVPPAQAEAMVQALRDNGVAVAYLLFPGEQHGFRQGTNIKRALDAELYFYGRVFGFTPADPLAAIPIDNLED